MRGYEVMRYMCECEKRVSEEGRKKREKEDRGVSGPKGAFLKKERYGLFILSKNSYIKDYISIYKST